MPSGDVILWEVDVQADFMLPGGKLYVPGAEKIIPNVNRLSEAARQGRTLLISSADALIPEARAESQLVIPNHKDFVLPRNLSSYQQILLEKNTLDVFDNPNTV